MSDTCPNCGDTTIADAELADLRAQLAERTRERDELRERNDLLELNAGTGGCCANAPEEMWMTADPTFGSDAWATWPYRVYMEGGNHGAVIQERIAKGRAVEPVRYVRADKLDAARAELARLTTPQPIGELHEDDGEVLAVNWSDDTLEYWQTDSLLSDGFDAMEYTHFYPLPKIQPPQPTDANAKIKVKS